MLIDNKVDDVKTILSQHRADTESLPQLHSEDGISRCHEHCRCRKCQRMMANTVSNGHVPSSTSNETDAHVPSQGCSEVDVAGTDSVPEGNISTANKTKDQFPPEPRSFSTPNGQVPSGLQIFSTYNETEGHVPSNSCSYTTENVLLPTAQTAAESSDLVCEHASDNYARIPSPPTSWTPQNRSRCHPLCGCDRCSQLVSSDDAVETGPIVLCRNERGYSGELLHFTFGLVLFTFSVRKYN